MNNSWINPETLGPMFSQDSKHSKKAYKYDGRYNYYLFKLFNLDKTSYIFKGLPPEINTSYLFKGLPPEINIRYILNPEIDIRCILKGVKGDRK